MTPPEELLQRLVSEYAASGGDTIDDQWERVGRASQLQIYRRRAVTANRSWRRQLVAPRRARNSSQIRLVGECVGNADDATHALAHASRTAFVGLTAFATSRALQAEAVEAYVPQAGCRRVLVVRTKSLVDLLLRRRDPAPEDWFVHTGTVSLSPTETPACYAIFQAVNDDSNGDARWFGFLCRQGSPGVVSAFGTGSLDQVIARRGSLIARTVTRLFQFGTAMRMRSALAHHTPPAETSTHSTPGPLVVCGICHQERRPSAWWSRLWPRMPARTAADRSCDVCQHGVCASCVTTVRVAAANPSTSALFVRATCCKPCLVKLHALERPPVSPPRVSFHTSTSWFRPDWTSTFRGQERPRHSPISSVRAKRTQGEETGEYLDDVFERFSAGTASSTPTDSVASFHHCHIKTFSKAASDDHSAEDTAGADVVPLLEDSDEDLVLEDLAEPEPAKDVNRRDKAMRGKVSEAM